MLKHINFKKSLRTALVITAAGAATVAPTGAAVATNNNGDQNAARQFSHQRGEREQRDGWWNDWRFGEGKENWENQPRTCEQRQASVNRETDRLKRSSDSQYKKIGWQVDYQKWYVDRHQLTPEGFEELIATTEIDKTEAKEAINALVSPTVDCAQAVENDKLLLQQNKQPVLTALRDYHVDAINITYAVQASK